MGLSLLLAGKGPKLYFPFSNFYRQPSKSSYAARIAKMIMTSSMKLTNQTGQQCCLNLNIQWWQAVPPKQTSNTSCHDILLRLAKHIMDVSPEISGRISCELTLMSDCAGMSSETWTITYLEGFDFHQLIRHRWCSYRLIPDVFHFLAAMFRLRSKAGLWAIAQDLWGELVLPRKAWKCMWDLALSFQTTCQVHIINILYFSRHTNRDT